MAIPSNKNTFLGKQFPEMQLGTIQESLQKTNPSLAALLDRSGILNKPAYQNNPNNPSIDPKDVTHANIDIFSGDATSLMERFDSEDQLVATFGIPPKTPPGEFAEFFRPLGTGASAEDTFADDAFITSVLSLDEGNPSEPPSGQFTEVFRPLSTGFFAEDTFADDAFITGVLSLDEGNPQMEGSVYQPEINPIHELNQLNGSQIENEQTDQNDLLDVTISDLVSVFSNDSIDVVSNPQELKNLISSIITGIISSLDAEPVLYFKGMIKYIPSNIKLNSENGRINLVLINDQLTEKDLITVDEEDNKYLKYLHENNIKQHWNNWVDKRFLSYLTGIFLKKFVPNPNSVFTSEQIELAVLLDRLISLLTLADGLPSSAFTSYVDKISSQFGGFCNSDSPELNLKAFNLFLETDPSTKIPVSRIQQAFKAFCKLIDNFPYESTKPAAKKRKNASTKPATKKKKLELYNNIKLN